MPPQPRVEWVRVGQTRAQPIGGVHYAPELSRGDLGRGIRLVQVGFSSSGEFPEGYLKSHVVAVNLSAPETVAEVSMAGGWKNVRREPGDVSVFPAGMPYSCRWIGPANGLLLELRPESLVAVTGSAAPGEFEPRPASAAKDPFVTHLALTLRDELQAGNPRGRLFGEALGIALAAHMLHTYAGCRLDVRQQRNRLPPAHLRRVTDYIEANLDRPVWLVTLAKVAGLSVFHFAHVFKETTGFAPHRYLLKRRIERGVTLLREQHLSMSEIALRCGFANQSHFASAFRRALGVSPHEYRSS
jgi:AraC family transcriptional regulator